jgi:hypothetical protein
MPGNPIPSDKLGDPHYVYYPCNIQCHKIKCDEITPLVINGSFTFGNGVTQICGVKSMNTVHTFTSSDIPALAKSICSGELTLYLQNEGSSVSNVTMSAVVKNGGTTTVTLFQRIGNMTSVEVSTTDIVFTCNPAVKCYWIWRGF